MNIELLKQIITTPGVSGNESEISKVVENIFKENGYETKRDNLGSIIAIKNYDSSKPTILIDAHMDEVGFIITNINSNGSLSFDLCGGISNKAILNQRVRVWSKDFTKSYTGVITAPGIDSHSGGDKEIEIETMFIDIGLAKKEDAISMDISIGNSATFDTNVEINNNRIIGKSLDNRIGLFILLELSNIIKSKVYNYNVMFVASTQEEVGLRGSRTSSYLHEHDLSIVIDVSPSLDLTKPEASRGELGKGTMIRYKDAYVIYSEKVIKYLKDIIVKNDIKHQDYFSSGGTNAGILQLLKNGETVIPIGLVARNLHTSSSVADLEDIDQTLTLSKKILEDLDETKIKELKERF